MSSILRTSSTAKAGYVANLHRAVYRAVFERDPAKARVAMVHHLLEAQKVIAEAASAPAPGNHSRFTLITPT